jgi:hypothetical protein
MVKSPALRGFFFVYAFLRGASVITLIIGHSLGLANERYEHKRECRPG